MEAKITMEKFMKLIKRTAGMRMGSPSAVEEITIIRNNELIYQGTETLILWQQNSSECLSGAFLQGIRSRC